MKVDLFGGASADPFCIGILNAGPKPNVLVSLTFACLAIDESNEEVTFLRGVSCKQNISSRSSRSNRPRFHSLSKINVAPFFQRPDVSIETINLIRLAFEFDGLDSIDHCIVYFISVN